MDVHTAADASQNVSDAKQLLAKHDAQAVVVLVIQKNGSANATMATATPEQYKYVDSWLREFIGNLPKNPFRTVFGWGNHGVPAPE